MTEPLPDSDPTPKPRGLWSVIPESPNAWPSETEFGEVSPKPLRSLFDLMRKTGSADADLTNPVPVEAAVELQPVADGPEISSDEISFDGPILLDAGDDRKTVSSAKVTRRTRHHLTGIASGLASLGLSVLALRPEVWMRLPGLVMGFYAMMLGYLSLTETHPSQRPRNVVWLSTTAILSGIVGIVLGPLYFSEWGRAMRDSRGSWQTRQHLAQIGQALKQHHDQHGSFPAGGTFELLPSKKQQGLHGWMTFLLPHVGEGRVYEMIDLSKPFDGVENRPAMGKEISVFYADGGDRTRIGQGFAVAHFAGVGGEMETEMGIVQAGIFDPDRPIRREDVTDGLAKTLAAGELAGNFPPWGDPANLRTVGRGLNKEINGFGNARGNGALFLFADGSVEFFGNRTDAKVLQQLSSRNGQEE